MSQPLALCGRITAFVSIVILAAPAARAQSDTGMVSREFATVLLRMVGDGPGQNTRPTIVTSVPASLASQVGTPPGARILGAVLWQSSADVIGVSPTAIDAVRGWFANDFIKRGYAPATNDAAVARFGGFREPITGPVNGYCGNNAYFTTYIRQRDQSTVEFRVRIVPNFGPCAPRNTIVSSSNPATRGAPLLYNPGLAERAPRCSLVGPGYAQSETGLVTSMSPAEMLAHYEKQLDSAGWKRTSPGAASSTWTRTDSAGKQLFTTISVSPIPGTPDCRTAGMRFGEIRP